MAVKLVSLENKDGDIYLPKTSVAQVIGLDDELAAKQDRLSQAQLDVVNSGIEGLCTVHFVQPGADLSSFSEKDLIIKLNE